MKVEFGKRYVMRRGDVTGELVRNKRGIYMYSHPFYDPESENSYRPDGGFLITEADGKDECDLVSEWVEPDVVSPSEYARAPSAADYSASKYHRTVPSTRIDIYDVIVAWDIRCPARQQALKKIMCAGERGAKGVIQDLDEAIQAVERAKELAQ